MKTKGFIEICTEHITNELEEYWSIQRDGNRHRYVNLPFKSKEEFLETYQAELDDPWEEIDDIEDIPQTEVERMEQEGREEISKVYDRIKARREEFLGEEEF